ncbi:sigma-70 family RNA polymerase sigma factor [Metabacillus sediminilitoris]|uniref:Sigma-70 family RNA polymerase sigma factor n=1 Tax=Metabacillus sediminilitoris TaxID=2567941 RepID=A0A4S4C009_9BACI|nr:sigma-70 family RNA polymerase sigma factor [Metabacillus sediminilitoris]QGQ47969.1 sigma-70 family RNA polymerase sigma factor [Metabacillus sediminilitoris]THF80917.1 sigma-70 family RNA polymerase sigma factor [Metabacillus sediminilitoris]
MHSNVREDLANKKLYKLEEYIPALLAYSKFLTKSSWDGEDIAQETFLKAIEKYGHKPEKISSALLKKMAYNQWIDTIRKRKKEAIEDVLENIAEMNGHPSVDKMEIVQYLLNHFTPKQAVILFLKEAFCYQSNEIAEILGTTEMAVKSILYRSKKRIEKQSSTELDWEKEERQLLSELFHDALVQQDPSILIRTIPMIHSLMKESITAIPSKTLSPSSVLCLAA